MKSKFGIFICKNPYYLFRSLLHLTVLLSCYGTKEISVCMCSYFSLLSVKIRFAYFQDVCGGDSCFIISNYNKSSQNGPEIMYVKWNLYWRPWFWLIFIIPFCFLVFFKITRFLNSSCLQLILALFLFFMYLI